MAIVNYKTLGQVRSGTVSEKFVATARVVTSNVATITTATNHGVVVGDEVYLNGIGGVLEGYQVVTGAPTTTTFTFGTTSASASSLTLPSTYVQSLKTGSTGVSVTNVQRTSNMYTVTTGSAHGCQENEYVTFSCGTISGAGTYKVFDAPSSTTFRVVSFGTDIVSTGIGGSLGAVCRVPATTIYQPASGKSGLISSLILTNNAPTNVTVDLYQTPSTAWASLTNKNGYILQPQVILAPYESYSVNLAMTIANQDQVIMCADTPSVTAFAYGTEFE